MNLSKLGICITVFYIGAVVILRFPSFSNLWEMPLNEFGDFFAGVFGPLMLLWVIVSVYLQKQELGQNTEALMKQAEELKKSVDQHKDLVNITSQQLKIDTRSIDLQEEIFRQQENDFTYIYERSNKQLDFILIEFNPREPHEEKSEIIASYGFSINFRHLISNLIEIGRSEFNLYSLKANLRDDCLRLLNKEIDYSDSMYVNPFEIQGIEDIRNDLLVFGLIRGEYVPERVTQSGNTSSTRSAYYRYELTEKLYKYLHWLEINNKLGGDIRSHLARRDYL